MKSSFMDIVEGSEEDSLSTDLTIGMNNESEDDVELGVDGTSNKFRSVSVSEDGIEENDWSGRNGLKDSPIEVLRGGNLLANKRWVAVKPCGFTEL